MGKTTGRDVHIDIPLTNVAIAYKPEGMIADQIAPIVPVNKQSDSYYVWNIADAFRTEEDARAPGTKPNKIDFSVNSDTYFAKNYALANTIPYEDIENADVGQIFTERTGRVEGVKDKLMLNYEHRVAQKVTSGSNVGSYSATASAWTDYTNSDPLSDIQTGFNNVQDATGYRPNSIVMGNYAWRLFRENDSVIDRMYGSAGTATGGRIITMAQAAALLEVDRFIVGGGYYNTTDEDQTESLSQIWNDNALAYYAPLTARKDKPSFMYSFRWNKIMNMQAFVFQDEQARAEIVDTGYYQDEKITASTLAFLVTGVGSSQ